MTQSTDKITGRLQTDDGVTVLTQSVRVSDYRESVRITADGELVRVEVGHLDRLHFSAPYHALSVTPAQARHLAGLLMKIAGEAEGVDFAPEDLARHWRGLSMAEIANASAETADE